MRARVHKWGNSLAVRIPKPFAEQAGLRENGPIDVSLADGKVLIESVSAPDLTLDDLLSQITDANLHSEAGSGPAVGNEEW